MSEFGESNEWSVMDVADLQYSIQSGDSPAEAAAFLRRDVSDVVQKAKELGLVWSEDISGTTGGPKADLA
jgi:hypothetical protein